LILFLRIVAADSESDEYLREVNSNEILAEIQNGEPVKYDHVVIVGDLDLDKLNLTTIPVTRRKEIEELGELDVSNNVKLIVSPITIYNSKIEGVVKFDNAFFDKPIYFIKTTFNNSSSFIGSQFNETADFEDALFNHNAYFIYSQFDKDINFKRSEFSKLADFRWSQLEGTEFKAIRFSDCQWQNKIPQLWQ
jgi:Pentapeptide repeats (9 copies)